MVKASENNPPHEAQRLNLQIDKAEYYLNWKPRWNFENTVARTISWYKNVNYLSNAREECLKDIYEYLNC